ncbi:hypothetical protein Acr_17g0012390 [Actinidia rufa]|uniref:CCHC-type domain-containing protein n=1 Tax=Actinidia rufa TaxID=165716 RepID=A0A7J0G4I1_9ERIC|nr:hypothetical protein Acr_17g0012390 [Actinidia rufa]
MIRLFLSSIWSSTPNRVGNGVRTHPHAPPEHRRVRSVSATRPGRSHAHGGGPTRSYAPERSCHRCHAPGKWLTRPHTPATRQLAAHAPSRAPGIGPRVHALEEEDQSESQALVLEGSRERGRGQGRGHHRGTGKGRWRSQARGRSVRCFYCNQEGHIKRDCPKYKAQDQPSNTAATAVMAVDESEVLLAASDNGKSDWVLVSGSAYHLCRDREVFSTYAACEGRIWMANNTSSRVVGKGLVRFRMADRRDAALTVVEELSEFPRETRRCCRERRLEGYTDWRGVSKQGELLSDMGPVVLARRMDKGSNRCTEYAKQAHGRDGATTTRKVTYFAAHPGGGCEAPHWGVQGTSVRRCRHLGVESYGGAGSEAVKKDNLKTSDYPPVGWRGRLLSPAHLDESKPTWMSPSPSPSPIGVHMECPCDGETLELSRTL